MGETFVRDEVSKDHGEHGIERDEHGGEIGVVVHDAYLEERHTDDDVDESDEQDESPIFTRQFVLSFFEVMYSEREEK